MISTKTHIHMYVVCVHRYLQVQVSVECNADGELDHTPRGCEKLRATDSACAPLRLSFENSLPWISACMHLDAVCTKKLVCLYDPRAACVGIQRLRSVRVNSTMYMQSLLSRRV
jgi:hypothetical protein